MLKRWNIYFKEMYPFFARLSLGYMLFFEILFLVILTNQHFTFTIGLQEIIGGFTVFGFLLFLRIADDFKDYETDSKLFPERPLPSGRVTKQDLWILLIIDVVLMFVLNLLFMNNVPYFLFLMGYGFLMSVWFFSRTKIQKNLPLALITHNPIQLIINLYAISFACIKYDLNILTYQNVLVMFSLYWDGLAWEIGRKIRAPKDETEYVTYSKLFGYEKVVYFIILIMLFDLITGSLMLMELFPLSVIGTVIMYFVFLYACRKFLKDPTKFTMNSVMEKYLYITELYAVLMVVLFLIFKV